MTFDTKEKDFLFRQKTRVDAVAEVIHAAILDGRLRPGTRLNQDRIAQELNVSRMPVREALKQLESRGLVVLHPYRGAEVSELSSDDVEEIFEMRIALETLAVRRAVPRLVDDDFAQLRSILRLFPEATENPAKWLDLNRAFHHQIYQATGWPHLQASIDELRHNVERYLRLYVALLGFERPEAQHKAIVEACVERDATRAEALTREHLRDTEQLLVAHLRREPSDSNIGSIKMSE